MAMATFDESPLSAAFHQLRLPLLSRAAVSPALQISTGHHKFDCWRAPMNPAQWKEEHFVIVSLSGWGLLIYGSYKFFTKGKKEEKLA